MVVEEITFEKLMELGHTDEIQDPINGLKKRKKKKRKHSDETDQKKTKTSSRPYTPTLLSPRE